MAVFLLLNASFRVKTGMKNSYAPRVPLLGIFVRTRDLRAHIAYDKPKSAGKVAPAFFLFYTFGNDAVISNKLRADEPSSKNRRA